MEEGPRVNLDVFDHNHGDHQRDHQHQFKHRHLQLVVPPSVESEENSEEIQDENGEHDHANVELAEKAYRANKVMWHGCRGLERLDLEDLAILESEEV